jgi:hypothetical protein
MTHKKGHFGQQPQAAKPYHLATYESNSCPSAEAPTVSTQAG